MPSDNLAEGYLQYRGADAEALQYQRDMEMARRRDSMATEEGTHDFIRATQKAGEFVKDTAENALLGTANAADQTVETVAPWLKDLTAEIPGIQALNDKAMRFLTKDDTANDVVAQKFFQYAIPFSGYLKSFNAITGATTVSKQAAGNAILADATTALTAIEPHFERFSDFLQTLEVVNEAPVLGGVVDYLAERGDNEAEERLKNVGDAMLAAGIASPLVASATMALRLMRRTRGLLAAGAGALTAGDVAAEEGEE